MTPFIHWTEIFFVCSLENFSSFYMKISLSVSVAIFKLKLKVCVSPHLIRICFVINPGLDRCPWSVQGNTRWSRQGIQYYCWLSARSNQAWTTVWNNTTRQPLHHSSYPGRKTTFAHHFIWWLKRFSLSWNFPHLIGTLGQRLSWVMALSKTSPFCFGLTQVCYF